MDYARGGGGELGSRLKVLQNARAHVDDGEDQFLSEGEAQGEGMAGMDVK